MLVREYIWKALYEEQKGYFETTDCLYAPPEPLPFRRIKGKADYTARVAALYNGEENAWLTPVEIFAPWYSYAVARWIIDDHLHFISRSGMDEEAAAKTELRIVEVGGGMGTNARHTLDYIKLVEPELYDRTRYTDVELSSTMGGRAEAAVRAAGHGAERFEVVLGDMAQWTGPAEEGRCYIIALEVLDNLPHDKVRVTTETQPSAAGDGARREGGKHDEVTTTVQQYEVLHVPGAGESACAGDLGSDSGSSGGHVEVLRPVSDMWIKLALEVDAELSSPGSAGCGGGGGAGGKAGGVKAGQTLALQPIHRVAAAVGHKHSGVSGVGNVLQEISDKIYRAAPAYLLLCCALLAKLS
jgi:hypothetical protein